MPSEQVFPEAVYHTLFDATLHNLDVSTSSVQPSEIVNRPAGAEVAVKETTQSRTNVLALPGLANLQEVKPRFAFSALAQPLQTMVSQPQGCWAVFRDNGKSFQQVFEDYVFVLAAIPSVCGFIGRGVFGSTSLLTALLGAIAGYLVSVLFLYGAAYLAHKTAELFDGAISLDYSGKLVVYSMMPFFFGGSLLLIPPLAWLSLIGTASIFLFIRGIDEMTRIAKPKRLTYGLINTVAWLVIADFALSNLF